MKVTTMERICRASGKSSFLSVVNCLNNSIYKAATAKVYLEACENDTRKAQKNTKTKASLHCDSDSHEAFFFTGLPSQAKR